MGFYGDNGKENGNYYKEAKLVVGLYWDNGKENGNYWGYRDSIRVIGWILGLYGDNGK